MPRPTAPERRGDAGYSLAELLVAMSIFAVVLGVFMSGLLVMSSGTNRVQKVGASADALRKSFTVLDRQVRSADAVNRPGASNGRYFVEFRTAGTAEVPAACYQWRYSVATGTLAYRTWPTSGAPASTWTTTATGLRTDVDAVSPKAVPFTLGAAGEATVTATGDVAFSRTRARLTVDIGSARSAGRNEQLATTFVAANTGPDSPGNRDDNKDGVSDSPVCGAPTTRT
ncbi:prepilin-type N-terminal cleavage/methylation domain-containing protein [Kineococcus sp. R8]|uniref:prepilin-type N-terminal cleavage/methylation domain-containing protein n=1 Tax=Kineococcus siccus TaxID=2696567 RepID=UPI00141306C8|nr:prepilin-type N-terminal cleavage/methylation domain-containing protein [Kineococcus siccus]NAZ81700.1 prepilin-type N-terminal cleavage/methylation domain-containing protein [Kineococcus siccus]